MDVVQVKGIAVLGGLMEWWRLYENVFVEIRYIQPARCLRSKLGSIAARLYTMQPPSQSKASQIQLNFIWITNAYGKRSQSVKKEI